jgi:glycosyltransferase involved in cell wall biosynthesis
MKLLLVTKGFPPRIGGVETLCRQLAEGLTSRGEDVTVVTFSGGRPAAREEQPYRVIELPSRGDVFEWSSRLVPALRGQEFDVCHVHNLHASVAAAVWAARVRPYVLTPHYHGGGHSRTARLVHPGYRVLGRRIVRGAAAVTAVSAAEASLLRCHFGADPEVIPNGVAPAHLATPPDRARQSIVVVSRLVRYKRVDAVIEALPVLPAHVLHIVGDGPEREPLLQLADRLGVRDRVQLTAERVSDPEVHRLLRDAAVYVNLSEAESFSYTVLESLAAGTPVVANGGPALAEWARRFPGAVLCADPAHPEQVAAAIRRLGGIRVEVDLGEYALPRVLDRYQRIYARVAG